MLLTLSLSAFAWQPDRAVKLYVAAPPGGPADGIARVLAEKFAKKNVEIVVYNKPGASGALATAEVAKSPADGYTLQVLQTTSLFAELTNLPGAKDYRTLTSFEHLAAIGTFDATVYANPNTVDGGIEQVIEDTKSGRKNYSWAVTNLAAVFAIKQIEDRIEKPINTIVYAGRGPAMNDFLGGHVDIIMDAGISPLAQQPTRAKFLASGNKRNSKEPTIDQVLPGIVTHSWSGISMPAGASPEVVKYYRETLKEIMQDPSVQEKFKQLGIKPTNESFSDIIANDIKRVKATAEKHYKQ